MAHSVSTSAATGQGSGVRESTAGERFATLPIYEPVYRPEQLADHLAYLEFRKVADVVLPVVGSIAATIGWLFANYAFSEKG